MVFPVVNSIGSVLKILDVAIGLEEDLGQEITRALRVIHQKYALMDQNKSPNQINQDLMVVLQSQIRPDELGVVVKHLGKILDAIEPLCGLFDKSQKDGAFPKYGEGLQKVVRKVQNALFEWNCFQGFYNQESEGLQGEDDNPNEIEVEIDTNHNAMCNTESQQADTKSPKTRLKKQKPIKLTLLKALNTSKKIGEIPDIQDIIGQNNFSLYFGNGESNRFLYLYGSENNDFSQPSIWRLNFLGNKIKLWQQNTSENSNSNPNNVTNNKDDNDRKDEQANSVVTSSNESVPGNQESRRASNDTEPGASKENTVPSNVSFDLQNKTTACSSVQEIKVKAEYFLILSDGLLKDLIYYSKKARSEIKHGGKLFSVDVAQKQTPIIMAINYGKEAVFRLLSRKAWLVFLILILFLSVFLILSLWILFVWR